MEQLTELIDLPRLFFNSLWVLGFSIIMAALSMHHYLAQEKNISFRDAVQATNFQLCLWGGLTLATIGFAGNATTWWEQILWVILTILNAIQLYLVKRPIAQDQT